MNLTRINLLIAEKLMGWKLVTYGQDKYFSRPDGSAFRYERWNPTTIISDAWKVLEKLESLGDVLIAKDFNSSQWEVEITIWQYGVIQKHFEVAAESAPLAICLAALKVIDMEESE